MRNSERRCEAPKRGTMNRGTVTAMSTPALSGSNELIPGWREDELPLHDKLDREMLVRAYRFGEIAHRGQVRNSGDPYITHSVEVAKILAELGLDTVTVAAGLLHDVIEVT